MLASRALLIAVGFAAMAGGGCSSKECTLKGCAYAFAVTFTKQTEWRPGAYRVEVVADDVRESCEVTMPLTCPSATRCQGGRAWVVEESGCGLAPPNQSISGVAFPSQRPKQVTVQVTFDGAVIGSRTFTPVFSESRPNGPGCDPVCWTAPAGTVDLQ